MYLTIFTFIHSNTSTQITWCARPVGLGDEYKNEKPRWKESTSHLQDPGYFRLLTLWAEQLDFVRLSTCGYYINLTLLKEWLKWALFKPILYHSDCIEGFTCVKIYFYFNLIYFNSVNSCIKYFTIRTIDSTKLNLNE